MKTLKEEDGGSLPVNNMGQSSSTPGKGGIDTFDPLLKQKKKLRNVVPMLKRKTM
jgi:hypothetical protein